MHRLVYFIRAALNNISQNLLVNLVSTGTIAIALLILSGFFLVQVNLQNVIRASAQDLAVTVYLKDGLSPAALDRLKKEAAGLAGTASLRYVSKEEALAELKSRLGDQGALLEGLEENPLPASLELTLNPEFGDKEAVKKIRNKLQRLEGVDDVVYAWDWAEKLAVFVDFVRLASLVVGGLLFLAVVFIIANTIRLTVLARREELYIMRLMGASESFIRLPFLIEGVLQGFFGALAALAGLLVFYYALVAQIELPFGLAQVKLIFLPPFLSWFLVAAGAVLGFLGTLISLGRFIET